VDIPLQLPAHRPARKILNIQFGKPGCDNKIAYIYTILGYDVINDPLFIKSYHYHRQQTRDYGFKDKIPEPYLFVSPLVSLWIRSSRRWG
jgi:hypothetical protein